MSLVLVAEVDDSDEKSFILEMGNPGNLNNGIDHLHADY